MKNFEELDLLLPLQRALADENYHTPTPIQAQTIPAALAGEDILGCAQTGTGKTAAFALPILDRLGRHAKKAHPNCPQALVLAPTRELAIQIGESFATYGRHLKLWHVLIYGGVKQGNQVRALARGAHILVATPGRLLDLMNQGYITLDQLQVFVLDEADRMLDMGFLPDLKKIISHLPQERQSLFFSATLPPNIVQLSARLLHQPVSVNVTPRTSSVQRIEQRLMYVEKTDKQALLRAIVSAKEVDRAIVFTRTKRGANVVADKLLRVGVQAVAIHGNKSQNARQRALEDFRSRKVHVLVATDVAARGIDIDGVTHVVNFDLPIEPEAYVHRIGRTGRAGAEGIALSFCSLDERRELRAIEQLIGQKVPLAEGQTAPPESAFRDADSGSRGRRGAGGGRPSSGGSRSSSGGSRAVASGSRGPGQGSGPRRPGSRRSTEIIGAADPVPRPRARRRRRKPQQTS